MTLSHLVLPLLALLLAACGAATPAPVLPTGSPSPSRTASSTATPPPPTVTPTPVLIPATLTTLVNVRSGPGTTYGSLGLLEAGESVLVLLQSGDGAWLQIQYPDAPDGYGWVAAAYVTLPGDVEVPQPLTPTPSGPVGEVLLRLNVRSGPAVTFPTIGTFEAGAVIALTARNQTGSWFQVAYPPAPGGFGWVASQYVRTNYASDLLVVDEYGQPVSTGTPGVPLVPALPTPTPAPALGDGDSYADPAARVIFSSTGVRRIIFSGHVSSPSGDLIDWLAFTPFTFLPSADARLLASLSCAGEGDLEIELWQDEAPLEGWGTLSCSDRDVLLVLPPQVEYTFRLAVSPTSPELRLVTYSLTLKNLP